MRRIAQEAEEILARKLPRLLGVLARASVGRLRNTTKCDSEKLTRKLAPIASTLPTSTGMK